MADSQLLINRIGELERRLALLEDEREIARLQNIYGFYLDNRMWGELAALFAENGEIEIGRRGGYRGRERAAPGGALDAEPPLVGADLLLHRPRLRHSCVRK
ncbi:MAG: nuclear transport factor 2 family protein [Steroidobacteraceae bacterium]